ncbi:hypothetical protein ABZV75_36755 [Streptomyces flaveolus]
MRGAGAVAPALSVSFVKSSAMSGGRVERITGTEGSSTGAVAILSGFERKGRWTVPKQDDEPPGPGAPRVIISGLAFWGGVGVERRLPRGERDGLRETALSALSALR